MPQLRPAVLREITEQGAFHRIKLMPKRVQLLRLVDPVALGNFAGYCLPFSGGCSSFRFSNFWVRGASRVRRCESPYDFSSFLTIFSLARGLGRDEKAPDGTVSGTR